MDDDPAANSPLRLMRKKWTADELAQEVYTLLARPPARPDPARAKADPDRKPDFRPAERKATDYRPREREDGPQFRFGSTGRAVQPPAPEPSPIQDRPGRRTPEADLSPPDVKPPDDPFRPRTIPTIEDPTRVRAPSGITDPSRSYAIPFTPPPILSPRRKSEGVSAPAQVSDPNVYDRPNLRYKDDSYLWRFSPYPPDTFAPVDSNTTLMGVVTGGTGKTYTVNLLPNGSAGAAGDAVTVQCPKVADDETIPVGTILAPVFLFTSDAGDDTYEAYPPVWLGNPAPTP